MQICQISICKHVKFELANTQNKHLQTGTIQIWKYAKFRFDFNS